MNGNIIPNNIIFGQTIILLETKVNTDIYHHFIRSDRNTLVVKMLSWPEFLITNPLTL